MSGLGELLLGKTNDNPKATDVRSPNNNNDDGDKSDYSNDLKDSSFKSHPKLHSNPSEKTFSDRVEKRNEDEESCSNASSVDDYVRELLDPNDRPRNVWHVVKAPQEPSDDRMPDEDYHRTRVKPGGYEAQSRSDTRYDANVDSSSADRVSEQELDRREIGVKSEEDHGVGRSEHHRNSESLSSSRQRDAGSRDTERRDRREPSRDHYRSSSSRHRSHRGRNHSDDNDDDDYRSRHRKSSRDDRDRSRRRSKSRSRSRSPTSTKRRDRRNRSNSPQRNSRTVIIMQLSQRVSSRDIEDYFSDHVGNVREVRLIMDGRTRRHKGVAYVEFEDSRSASKALSYDGRKLNGTPLTIQAVDSKSTDHHSSHSKHHSSTSLSNYHSTSSTHPSSRLLPPNAYRVYIGALHTGISDEMLRTIVEPFGPVLRVEVIKDRTTGVSRGYAFVTYANIEDGQEAVRNLDGFELAGKNMRVSKSTEKGEH